MLIQIFNWMEQPHALIFTRARSDGFDFLNISIFKQQTAPDEEEYLLCMALK